MSSLFPNFESELIEVNGVSIMTRKGGAGRPLLLIHGHPQTHAIWHRVAQELAKSHTVVMTDLRGYGDSSKPEGAPDHLNYSKRTMALDQIEVMRHFGFAEFDVLAHDRGARVAHRLALDHPKAVKRLLLLDIAPTLAMYEKTSNQFARAYWHWFFLIQPSPLPERLIQADPSAYVRDVMGRRSAGLAPFDPRALAEYMRCMELPGAAHGLCEDYRASATIDLVHDQLDIDAKNLLQQPLLILWGEQGVVNQCFDPLKDWSKVAVNVKGHALPCGHYIPEEAPELLLQQVQSFLE
ncbi:MAG: alpha/beta hydrolase [Betaproteobacteria bacterium]|jgi:haloacetate dehalogenase